MQDDPQDENETVRLTVSARVRHADLLAAARRLGSQSALAKALGIQPGRIGAWINLQKYPVRYTAQFEAKVVAATGFLIEDLWPDALKREIDRRRAANQKKWNEIEVTSLVSPTRLASLEVAGQLQIEDQRDWEQIEELHIDLEEAMRSLNERERTVVKLRNGWDGEAPRTYEEVGRIVQLSGDRVRQIEARAVHKLRHPWRSIHLEKYVGKDG